MDKYKDFRELKDTSEQSLRNLFVKRCYGQRIDSPYADDIRLYENVADAFDDIPEVLPDGIILERGKKGRTKDLTPKEIAQLRASKANVALQLPEDTSEKCAKRELLSLNPLEVEDYYISKRVKAYLDICNKIIQENKPAKNEGKQQTFAGLFRDPDNAKKVKDILESRGYTVKGKWQGLTGEKSELLSAFYVLKPLLKPIKPTPGARIFYSEFGLLKGYIQERSYTNEPFGQSRNDFEEIFSPLLETQK